MILSILKTIWRSVPNCRNPSLGLATKARGCKVVGQEGDPGVTSHAPGVQRVWGNEPSHSQVNSHCESWSPKWTPESSERDYKGQNPLVGTFPYIIGKLLKHRCLKWARIAHLDIWSISYDQKKGRESNWHFDFRPLKVGNQPNFLACKQRVIHHWKALDEGYNFVLNLIVIEGLYLKWWASKVMGILAEGIFEIPTWESWDKKPFGCGPHGEVQNIL